MIRRIIPLAALLIACAAHGQKAPHTGCVNPWPGVSDTLTLSQKNSCSVLAGKAVTARLAGHTVTLTGTITEATESDPQTLTVTAVQSVGEECSATCTPHPPGERGVTKRPKPGLQGSTPGEKNTPRNPD